MLFNVNNSSSPTVVTYIETTEREKVMIQLLASIGSLQAIINLTTILTCKELRRKITYVFIINLLFAQLLMSTVTIPMYCFAPHHFLYPYITALTIIAYILNLCTVTYERYMAICKPYQYAEKVSYSKALKTSVMCWIVALITQILPIFWNRNEHAETIQRIYLAVTLFLFFILPLVMIWLVYAYISFEMFKLSKATRRLSYAPTVFSTIPNSAHLNNVFPDNNKQKKSSQRKGYFTVLTNKFYGKSKPKQEFHLALVFIAAAIASNITWVPVILMVLLQVINRADLEPRGMSKIHVYLLVINANVDPLIYGLFLKPLRERIISVFFLKLNKTTK